ncbi:alpha/beta hydrolase [Cellulomonas soli]|uniref:Uncharacterized protein n=1 Tax=Cellulomonas soli TaxID=931535 RepID=A0A512PI15_9CELL|nr:alpha/beta hydrolase [Cellulomonas soli]NYI58783.1 hypothetical protein [Cellulomonas soli]GEP70837.1 hypothetical protein CSO01_35520 [Cellulomonas soli]
MVDVAPGYTVLGGRGPTTAEIEDLTAAAALLRLAVARLEDAAADLHRVRGVTGVALLTGQSEARAAHVAVAAAIDGAAGPDALADDLRRLADGLTRAATVYVDAEDGVQRTVRVLASGVGWWIGEHPGPALVLALGGAVAVGGVALVGASATGLAREAATGGGPLTTVLGLAAQRGSAVFTEVGGTQALVAMFANAARALPPGTQVPTLAPVPSAAGTLLGVLPQPGTATVSARSDPPQLPVPQDTAGVLANVARSYAPHAGGTGLPGTSEATISVQRLDHPDGTRSWVVEIPGTQDGGVAGEVPTDMSTNLQLMAQAPDDMTAAVVQAMHDAGIGADEPVLLAGHSQGGMVAMNVASAAAGTFAVKAVVTAGSPDLPGPPPPGVQVLAIRHTADAVPQTDGTPDHGTAMLTVVTRDLDVTGQPGAVSTIEAHDVRRYVDTAGTLPDAVGDDPGYQRFLAVAEPLLGEEGTTAVTTQYEVSRAGGGS